PTKTYTFFDKGLQAILESTIVVPLYGPFAPRVNIAIPDRDLYTDCRVVCQCFQKLRAVRLVSHHHTALIRAGITFQDGHFPTIFLVAILRLNLVTFQHLTGHRV